MPDVFTTEKRSQVMSRIRASGNKSTELALIRFFRQNHLTGWRRHQDIYGKPDFVFRSVHLAVFVDGCFWHGCTDHCKVPGNNRDFWENKLRANKARDRKVTSTLRADHWHVLRIWEHDLKPARHANLLRRFRRFLNTH